MNKKIIIIVIATLLALLAVYLLLFFLVPGKLLVESDPNNIQVVVDGQTVTTPTTLSLKAGSYTVSQLLNLPR
jgi:type IV secretory pathway VirB3-like protein